MQESPCRAPRPLTSRSYAVMDVVLDISDTECCPLNPACMSSIVQYIQAARNTYPLKRCVRACMHMSTLNLSPWTARGDFQNWQQLEWKGPRRVHSYTRASILVVLWPHTLGHNTARTVMGRTSSTVSATPTERGRIVR